MLEPVKDCLVGIDLESLKVWTLLIVVVWFVVVGLRIKSNKLF